ncbi:hypothetical protein LWI28_013690 [Acer negundo]|uniref:Reverse transcriptase Ty1/copia-type domain-containing protein n=1 Tax=Acer negundo TaxID=4023 RepID=A0AAD5JD19_ACENE|nr:hypothetical protein LWI28_013690 [Acer negundo]
MDVKSAFLNGFLQEKVFVEQPKGFVDAHHPNHVYRLKKALYGLKQAPRAWYECLTQFLVDNYYTRGSVDKTLFIKKNNDELFIAQIYVDDIVFVSTNNTKVQQFVDVMSQEFKMSLVGNCDDWKSTSDSCFFLGNNLVSWFCKKQNSISLSTAEAEYIAVGSGCTQLLWMKQMLVDYGFNQGTLTLFCDNMSAINISKNPVQHSRTKHIDIRHHFIRELAENKCIVLEHVGTNDQLADQLANLFTKPLDATRFHALSRSIGICLVE